MSWTLSSATDKRTDHQARDGVEVLGKGVPPDDRLLQLSSSQLGGHSTVRVIWFSGGR